MARRPRSGTRAGRGTRGAARRQDRRSARTRQAPRVGRAPRTRGRSSSRPARASSTPKRNSSPAAGSYNGSPSMSKKTSPGEGAGSRPSPSASSARGDARESHPSACDGAGARPGRGPARPSAARAAAPRAPVATPRARERRHLRRAELLDPVAPYRGDPREVVVGLPPRLARRTEVAPAAVVARPRVGRGWLLDVRPESRLRAAEIRRDVFRPEALGLPRAEHHVEPLRHPALDGRDLVRVPGELEHGGRLRAPRKLGVVGLVAPRAEVGRLVDPHDEVGAAAPAVPRERRLVDHLGASTHRVDRGCVRLLECARFLRQLDLDDGVTRRPQLLEVRGFVRVPLLRDELRELLAAVRLPPLPPRDLERERRQVRAGEVRR